MTRAKQTRQLARAFARLDKAEEAYRAAQRQFDEVYQPWAAGLVTDRDEARQSLVLCGLLEKRTAPR